MTALVEDALLVLILAAMVGLAATQIVLRNLFDGAILWADPMLRVAVLWVGMIGAMVATRIDKQISVDAVSRFLPLRWKGACSSRHRSLHGGRVGGGRVERLPARTR